MLTGLNSTKTVTSFKKWAKDLTICFTKKDVRWKIYEKCSISSVNREMQIKIILSCYYIPIRMAMKK